MDNNMNTNGSGFDPNQNPGQEQGQHSGQDTHTFTQPSYAPNNQEQQTYYAPQSQPIYNNQMSPQGQQPYGTPYGAPQQNPNTYYAQPVQQQQQSKGLGIASMVLGIFSVITVWFGIGIVSAIVGLILGIVGRSKNKSDGFALAGIILSSLMLAVGILYIIIVVAAAGSFLGGLWSWSYYY